MFSLTRVQVAAVTLLLQLAMVANGTRGHLVHFTVIPPRDSSNCLNCSNVNFNTSSDLACCLAIDDVPDYLPKGGEIKITFESNHLAFNLSKSMVFASFAQIEIRGPVPGIANVSCVKQGVGIMFDNIPSVNILNVEFQKCGAKYQNSVFDRGGKIIFFRTSLFFERCGNVQLNRTFVCHSPGFGVTMYDATGDCVIYKSYFHNNTATDNSSVVGGGGLYIEFTPRGGSTVTGNYSSIHISNCTFSNNYAGTLNFSVKKTISESTFSQGGGIFIRFQGSATLHSFITITHCQIINNTAEWGGGLHIEISNSTRNKTVHISDTVLANNTAITGGGGMVLYIKRNAFDKIAKVQIIFKRCKFTWNWAGKYGGGSMLSYRLRSEFSNESYVLFYSCRWVNNNTAKFLGSAVDISTKFTTKKTYKILSQFKNCTFKKNRVLSTIKGDIVHEGRAAFMVSGSSVLFKGTTMFRNNNGSALYALSSKIQFSLGSHANFINNIGRNGGAITLISSSLYVKNHVRLDFIRNKAYLKGGAIYSLSLDDFGAHRIYPYNCFLHSDDNIKSNRRNITLNFSNNSAAYTYGKYNGRSIYTTSLLSCTNRISRFRMKNLTKVLSQIARFKFPGSHAYAQVVTSEASLSLKESMTIHAIPGKEVDLNIFTKDEFGHIVPSSYRVFIRNRKRCHYSALTVDNRYKSLPNNKIKLHGSPGTSCQISIEMEGNRQIYALQRVSLEECPPGFILRNETKEKYPQLYCGCPSNSSEEYLGFTKCDDSIFRTRIRKGIWTGYDSNGSERALRVAYCPHSFCSYDNSSNDNSYFLPGVANQMILDEFVCEKGRTGKLCGSCRSGYSVHFNSPEYSCKRSTFCSLGWLLYIVSELVPLTIIFAIVLKFNINFTSGALTGFLFYAQIIDSLGVSAANKGKGYPNWTLAVIKATNFVYGFFNLNFFAYDTISFCLWEGAGTLDIIMFKFVTIGFAFFLVLSVFLITNICTLTCRQHSLRISSQQSVIHGITAFLVVCLVQTIKVTFFVFSSATVYKKGGIISSYQAFYEGSFTYLHGKHLIYAIPSLLVAITIAFAPTFLLLWYPLVPKIIAKCGFGETKLVRVSEKLLLINRLKPVIDSFQGSYKDSFRFFAGLLFLYRIIILASITFSFGYTQSYILIQAQLAVMLLAQFLAQPYKDTIHNILDFFLLFNLSIINILTIFISNMSLNSRYQLSVHVAAAAQALFTALPLLCLLAFVCKKILRKIICCSNRKQAEQNEESDIPFRLLEESTEPNG